LHCPGCTGGQSLGVLAVAAAGLAVAYETVAVVAAHIWEIGGTVAACAVLSAAAVVWLESRTRRREAAWAAARGIYSRGDLILPERVTPPRRVTASGGVTIQFINPAQAQQAEVIRALMDGGHDDPGGPDGGTSPAAVRPGPSTGES
jgi:hypothetical protein